MKIGVIYSTLTGNTKKLANAIFAILPEEKFMFHNGKDMFDFESFDLIILGYWCKRTFMDPLTLKLLEQIKGKKIAVFGTAGMYPWSEHAIRCRTRIKEAVSLNNEFLGDFLCQGKIPEERTLKRMQLPKDDPHYLDEDGIKRHIESRMHPDQQDLLNAQQFFKELIARVK